jgi:hypothetical protein
VEPYLLEEALRIERWYSFSGHGREFVSTEERRNRRTGDGPRMPSNPHERGGDQRLVRSLPPKIEEGHEKNVE